MQQAKHIATRLRLARQMLRMSQKAAAIDANISQQYLSDVEQGKSSPPLALFVRLCTIYGTPPNDILLGDAFRRQHYVPPSVWPFAKDEARVWEQDCPCLVG